MDEHDADPKVFFVKAHVRWRNGELFHVEGYFRMIWPPVGYRRSPLQLAFGFYA
jgi:hypothetical protein